MDIDQPEMSDDEWLEHVGGVEGARAMIAAYPHLKRNAVAAERNRACDIIRERILIYDALAKSAKRQMTREECGEIADMLRDVYRQVLIVAEQAA